MKKIIAILAAVLTATGLSAQNSYTVSGTVKDSHGEALVGATVMVDGTTSGAMADINGKYTLTFTAKDPSAVKIVFTCLSYQSRTETVGKRNVIDVVLQDDLEQLEDVVVIGYGAMKKSDLTGSVTSVQVDEMQAAQSGSLDQLLQGRAAGVQVVSSSAAPDASSSIIIRGASSFNTTSQPLIVVDGVIMNTSSDATVGSHGGENSGLDQDTNGLMGINPQDIESMEVLKDASATAIFGSEGANGVILITTRSAAQEKPSINFTAGLSVSNIYKKFDLLDTDEFAYYLREKGVSETSSYLEPFVKGVAEGKYVAEDWQDYTTRVAYTQRYYFTISGRPHKTNYLFSLGFHGNSGIVKGTGYENPTMRLNLDRTIKKFKIGTKTSLSFLHSKMTQGVGSTIAQNPSSSLVMSMLRSRPLRKIIEYDEEGAEILDDDAPLAGPDRWLTDFESFRNEFRVTPSFYAEYKMLEWLSFKSTFGMDFRTTEQSKFKSRRINMQATGSNGAVTHIDRMNWNWDNLIMFNKWFKKNHFTATLGQSCSQRSTITQTVEGINIDQWKAMTNSLNSASSNFFVYSENYNQLLSFFARMMFAYHERYILTATYRVDGSSRFAGNNKWATFPSFAFAWRMSNEPWFKVDAISSAKLRLGYGRVGNQAIPSYQTMNRYTTSTAATHDTDSHQIITISSLNLPNPDLKWETTTQYNAGLDMGFFKGRLTFGLDAYYKVTEDLLQTRILAGSAGVNNPYVNMGSISNKGLELTLTAVPYTSKKFEWKIGGNFTLNRNRIISIDPNGSSRGNICLYRGDPNTYEVDYFTGANLSGDSICKDYINIFIAGQPMCMFYGMPTDGLVQEGQTGVPFEDGKERGPGSINFLDTNGDGKISSADRVIIGNPNPVFTYGFNTSFKYKNLGLSADFVGSYGNDVYNQQAAVLTDIHSNNLYNVLRDCVYDTWSPSNPDAKYPAMDKTTTGDANWCTDRFIEDGSYLRLANLSVSYSIPFKKKSAILKRLTFGLSGKNLFCLTRYSGYDPDVSSYGTMLKYGIDNGSYPAARTYMFDLKFTF